jgi:Cytochrome c oxidase assembly protein PET191
MLNCTRVSSYRLMDLSDLLHMVYQITCKPHYFQSGVARRSAIDLPWTQMADYHTAANVPMLLLPISQSLWSQPSACSEAALSILTCMEKTECAQKGTPLIECMRDEVASDPCRAQRNAYYNCKHSQLNMRTRIRGVRVY